jgi:hypothetical protein
MEMNIVSYKLCKLSVCLMCFQIFFMCINHFLQFTPFLLGPLKIEKKRVLLYRKKSWSSVKSVIFHSWDPGSNLGMEI